MGNADAPLPHALREGEVQFPDPPPYGPHLHTPPGLGPPDLGRRGSGKMSLCRAYLFALPPVGIFGGHHFYLRRPEFGLLYLFTAGLLGMGWLLDLLRMPLLVKSANERRAARRLRRAGGRRGGGRTEKSLLDAYILWMPLGILGFHHYYLGRWPWAVAYTFTAGLAGTGWLFDGCRMEALVREVNDRRRQAAEQPGVDLEHLPGGEEHRSLVDAYVLGLSVFGLLGAHQYYMGRFFVGMVYTFSGGLVGLGWMYDWFTMSVIFKRSQHVRQHGEDGLRYLDDAYRFLWPLGFLGLHHFYLRRPGWGCLYLFTLGLFLVGWIADVFRLPRLVKEANKRVLEERAHLAEIRDRLGPNTQVMGNQHYYVAYPTRDATTGGVTCPTLLERTQPVVVSVPPAYSQVVVQQNTAPNDPPPSYQPPVNASMATISEEAEEEEHFHPGTTVGGVDNLGYGVGRKS